MRPQAALHLCSSLQPPRVPEGSHRAESSVVGSGQVACGQRLLALPAVGAKTQSGYWGPFPRPQQPHLHNGPVVPHPRWQEQARGQGQLETDRSEDAPRLLKPLPRPAPHFLATGWQGPFRAHISVQAAVLPQLIHPLPGKTRTPLLCTGFSEAPRATASDTLALLAPNLLEVQGWRQAEGPLRGATVSSMRPEPQTLAHLHLTPPGPR